MCAVCRRALYYNTVCAWCQQKKKIEKKNQFFAHEGYSLVVTYTAVKMLSRGLYCKGQQISHVRV